MVKGGDFPPMLFRGGRVESVALGLVAVCMVVAILVGLVGPDGNRLIDFRSWDVSNGKHFYPLSHRAPGVLAILAGVFFCSK